MTDTPDSSPGTDIAVGDEGPTLVEEVSRVDFVKYAGASGDFNPLHVDENYATDAGNPSVFGHGMYTAGIASRMLADWFGVASVRRFRVRFTDQVWPGDTLTVAGEVTDTDHDEGDVVVDVEFEVENQDGEVVLSGDATAALPPE
jgi:peroxisomal enoyl-CoA hydratase 2